MTRVIEGTIYKLSYTSSWHILIECSSKQALFEYIADEIMNGRIVSGVVEVRKDGTTPRVRVHTNREFKRILKERQKRRQEK